MRWDQYEDVVQDIQERLGEGLRIQRDVRIADSDGIKRQFDVVCTGRLQNAEVLYVTECKHRSRPVGMDQVEAFNQKANSVNANVKAIYSSSGFRKNALRKAKAYGINCYSISKNGITVDNEKTFGWHNFAKQIAVRLVSGTFDDYNRSGPPLPGPLRVSGIDIVRFLRACVEKQVEDMLSVNDPERVFDRQIYSVSVRPRKGREYFMVSFDETRKRCRWIRAKVEIYPIVKMKFTRLTGLGVYDHHGETVSLPGGHRISGPTIDMHDLASTFNSWDVATKEALEAETVRLFWLNKIPVPKSFRKSSYSIHVRSVR